jgi:hypothetical protein
VVTASAAEGIDSSSGTTLWTVASPHAGAKPLRRTAYDDEHVA